MVVQFPQLSRPLTASALVRAVDSKVVETLFQSDVRVHTKRLSLLATHGATFSPGRFHLLDADLAVALSTTRSLMGLLQNVEADWAVSLNAVGRRRDKITVESSHDTQRENELSQRYGAWFSVNFTNEYEQLQLLNITIVL